MRAWPILFLAVACSLAGRAEPPTEPTVHATRANTIAPSYEVVGFQVDARDENGRSVPRFTLRLSREMNTPGWKLHVDTLDVDRDARRIVAHVTETGPGGIVAQVITPTELRLDLGPLSPGRWVLEIRSRRGEDGPFTPQQALVFNAR